MAKSQRRDSERRAIADRLQQEQKRREKRRSFAILGFSILVVVGLLAAALIPYISDQREKSKLEGTALAKIGASRSAAGCDAILTRPTDHTQEHVPAPTPIAYKDAPPSFGAHRPEPAAFERKYYTAQDRPEVAALVHNLEHGYTILWYDATLAGDKKELNAVKAIADKMTDERFIAAPWTKDDGSGFPSGKHLALTRWTAAADNPGDEDKQRGNWQYCSGVSGSVVADFSAKWPNAQSPEPGIM